MPTSTTAAPSLIQSALTISGRPTAATRMSAWRQTADSSRVREWAMVTVQLSFSSSCAMGRPTSTERPMTTALRPERSPSVSRSIIRQPSGVQGMRFGRPLASRPAFSTFSPSTSLRGSMASITACSSKPLGSGICTRMPWMAGSAFRARTRAIRSSCLVSAGSRWVTECSPASRLCSPLERTYIWLAGSSPTSTTARPGVSPCSALRRAASTATSARTRSAPALKSMIRASLMGRSVRNECGIA